MHRILHVAAEIFPWQKTGGLGDVMAGLPPALAGLGLDVRLLLPGLPALQSALAPFSGETWLEPAFGARAVRLRHGRVGPLPAYILDAPDLYDRPGGLYADPEGRPFADNHRRFALLGWAAARMAEAEAGWQPDIIHAHDWHAALAPAFLKAGNRQPRGVFTIHNLAYQGDYDAALAPEFGLPMSWFGIDGFAHHGKANFMKAGITYADAVTTVSPRYADEIRTPDQGFTLDGALRAKGDRLGGILNGIDHSVWNPATDPFLAEGFDPARLSARARTRERLQGELGLDADPAAPIAGVVSRLSPLKGLDLLPPALPHWLNNGGQFALLGTGDPELERAFMALAAAHPGRVAVRLGYDEALAHRFYGGCDAILMPSRSEPCGLSQMYAMRYGAVPVVRRTGGLADSVVDASAFNLAAHEATGIVFNDADVGGMGWALDETLRLFHDRPSWRRLQAAGMAADHGWPAAAAHYAALYRRLA